MSWLESLLLGLLQGLTEYLPISSSGHLAIASSLFGIDGEQNMAFTVLEHVATVLSTLDILWKEIVWILRDLFSKQSWKSYSGLNEGTRYAINIIISMIPVGIVGVFFKDKIEAIFGSGMTVVGYCLLVTAALLTFSYYAKPRQRENISGWHAFIIGIAQAVAVLPGISRSGSTIATGIMLGNKKERLAQFSFLMVLIPILGEAFLDLLKLLQGELTSSLGLVPAVVGFVAAFATGCFACRFMIEIVRRQRLVWFALYCAIVGTIAIITTVC